MPHDNLDHINYKPYLNELRNLQKLFVKLKFSMCLHGGTLLGSIRQKDFIKNDDDIDVFYISHKKNMSNVISEFNTVIQPFLENKGYIVEPISWTLHGKKTQLFGQYHISKNNITLDVWSSWIDESNKFYLSPYIVGTLNKKDIFPLKTRHLKKHKFSVPNKYEKLLEQIYGPEWKIPADFRAKVNRYFFKKNILKLIDEYGWAYHFIAKDQQKYSIHNISCVRLKDFDITMLKNFDILYIPSPGLGVKRIENIVYNAKLNNNNIKIIGAYAGERMQMYKDQTDLIAAISAKHYKQLCEAYSENKVIFLPEGVDAKFFHKYNNKKNDKFIPGFAGRDAKVKRLHILKNLNYPIKTQTEHSKEFFTEDRNQDAMVNFYNSISCLLLSSISECMPRVILEAMACELPIVSTDVGSVRLLIEDEWLVPVEPDDIVKSEINKRLHILSKYPALLKEIGKRNRKHIVDNFDWSKVQPLWDEVFSLLSVDKRKNILEKSAIFNKKYEKLEPSLIAKKSPEQQPTEVLPVVITKPVENVEAVDTPTIVDLNIKDKKIVLYSKTPMLGVLWDFYTELKNLNLNVSLMQNNISYKNGEVYNHQHILSKSNDVCKNLLLEADIIIFVQYYNEYVDKLTSDKLKIALCCGAFPCGEHNKLLSACKLHFTTKPDVYKSMVPVDKITEILWKI